MSEWYETFFDNLGGKAMTATWDHPAGAKHARMVKKLVRARKGARVLDIPGGMGRLTVPLARMGCEMTGVDLNAGFITRVRRHAKREGLPIRLLRCDMREIAFDDEFDAAVNFGGSFGYFSNHDNRVVCERVFKALRPGGRFLIDGLNKSWMIGHFKPTLEMNMGPVKARVRNWFDPETGRSHATWTFSKGKIVEERESHMWIFNGTEMRSLLRKAGFREITLYGWPPVGRLTRHSRRVIAVATRPE